MGTDQVTRFQFKTFSGKPFGSIPDAELQCAQRGHSIIVEKTGKCIRCDRVPAPAADVSPADPNDDLYCERP